MADAPTYPPLPPRRELGMGLMYEPVEGFNADDMRAFVDADRAARASQPFTDAQVGDLCGEANRGFCIESEHYFKAFRDAEEAHGISAPSTPTPEVAPCTTPTLLACPFCGGPANFLDACEPRKPLYWAECKACGVPGADDVSVEGAAAKWNHRATVTHGVGATIEWQVRGRHHYEWRRASEEIARAMYPVNPGHVRAVTVVEGAVPKAG